MPNNRSFKEIDRFAECVLVELTHEDVGAEYISSHLWSTRRTQFVAVDEVGEAFSKRHYDARLGWDETRVSRRELRDELLQRTTRTELPALDRTEGVFEIEPDTFSVKPKDRLRRPLSRKRSVFFSGSRVLRPGIAKDAFRRRDPRRTVDQLVIIIDIFLTQNTRPLTN